MRVKDFILPEKYARERGLSPISMRRLGRVVALAGKNGSGKSRILDALLYASEMRNHALVNRVPDAKNKNFYESYTRNSDDPEVRRKWEEAVMEGDERQRWLERLCVDHDQELQAVGFVPKRLQLDDPLELSSNQLIDNFERARAVDVVDGLASACLGYIQQCQNRYWHVSHQEYSGDSKDRAACIESYNSLKISILNFLGAELSRSNDGAAQIFGRNIFKASLSDGQKILLQLAVAIHAKMTAMADAIFVLDEPENHLHPSVAIDLVEKIFEVAPDAQVWIATHSVPLLAHVVSKDPMALWCVNEGSVSHAGRNPGLVLESLLGGDERIAQLHAFAGLPSQLAAVNYAAESLVPPSVVPFSDSDPQVNQIGQILVRISNGRPVRVLDFGAGKGRLLEGLAAINPGCIKDIIDYFALDSSYADAVFCKSCISQLYGDSGVRHFSTIDSLLNELSEFFFDVVVMCNVLHEIAPSAWLDLFSEGSALTRAISPRGYVLIVEDLRIPTGEKAHECGFLVLDTQHLKIMFGVTENDVKDGRFITCDARGDGRLKAHLIAKDILGRISAESRVSAIEALSDTAYRQIQELRVGSASYLNGMYHGFWTQQFANASIFLRSVKGR